MTPPTTPGIPAAQADLLRRCYEIFDTQDVEAFTRAHFHPDVEWPNVAEGTRLHGIDAVLAYWRAQFAVGHPLVRLEGMTRDPDGRIRAQVRPGAQDVNGDDRWAERTVQHLYTFHDGKVARREVREGEGQSQERTQGYLRDGLGDIPGSFRQRAR
ncbi:nuclear transport factor 2 family protein [Streptomyces sp. NPDC048483]|uniref:nuclear transport factor 2 family protein n=1 Tax=Streptomyces sp. NPDC048483 TaxID=3154927 RepID=UPI00342F30F2